MRTLTLILTCSALLCTGCGKVFTLHIGSESAGFSSGGGMQWILRDGGPRMIVEHSTILLPKGSGDMIVSYEPSARPGTFVSLMQLLIDGKSYATWNWSPNNSVKIANHGDGTHAVKVVIYRRYVGDRRSAPTDTINFRIKTYYSDYEVGLQWLRFKESQPIYDGSTIDLPTSAKDLTMAFRVSAAMAEGRFCSQVDWFVDGVLVRRSAPPFTHTFRNTGDGDHEVRCVAHFTRVADLQPAGDIATTFIVRTWKDVF